MRILHGECYCPTVDTVYAPWRSENFRITCDDDKYHKWQSHFHSSLLIEKSSKFITSTAKVDGQQPYYTVYVHTIPYHTPQKFMDYLSQQFYTADERINFDHINFYRLLCQTIKSIEKRFQVLTHYWFQMNNDGTVHVFFSQRCQNIIIFHIIEQKNTVFMQWLTSSLSLQKPIRCCP